MLNFGIIGAFCVFTALALTLYRLHKTEEDIIAGAGFASVDGDGPDDKASAAAKRFTGRELACAYAYKRPYRYGRGPVHLFKHVPTGDEPQITCLVAETDTRFEKTAVVHKVYGSHLLFGLLKKTLIKTGDLGIEGGRMVELDEFNRKHFGRYSLFAMGETGFETNDPYFMKLVGALRGLDRKSVIGLGVSGRHIAAWSAKTALVLKLWESLPLYPRLNKQAGKINLPGRKSC